MRVPTLLAAALLALAVGAPGAANAQSGERISRLPNLADPPTDPVNRQVFEDTRKRGGEILNLHWLLGHAPAMSKARRTMAYALRFDATSPRLLREVVILRIAHLIDGDYEERQHLPLALKCGLTKEQLADLPRWRTSTLFDDKTRATLAFTDAMVKNQGDVDDPTYAAFAKHVSPPEIVELTVLIGAYVGNIMLTKALRLEIEKDGRGAAPGSC
jgi:alkylhydroperoxidase family enzyme